MAKTFTLKFVDRSSKECEVTGRNMGHTITYYQPISDLKPGPIDWNTKNKPDHTIIVDKVEKNKVVVEVRNSIIGKHVGGPYTIYEGVETRLSYMFGEWEYGFSLSIEAKNL